MPGRVNSGPAGNGLTEVIFGFVDRFSSIHLLTVEVDCADEGTARKFAA